MGAEWTKGLPARAFTYDSAGHLVEARVLTLTTRFKYNGLGARLAVEVVGRGTTTYTLDYATGGGVLAEATITGTARYLYGHDCLGEVAGGQWLYYLADGLGYVRQGADELGQVGDSWLFDPDGSVLEGPQGPVSHLVCGGVYDWSTGLIYKGGRYFDPLLGIWLALAPLLVVQSWRGRKRKRGGAWHLLLVLLVVGVGGTLTGCVLPPKGDTVTPEEICATPTTPGTWASTPVPTGTQGPMPTSTTPPPPPTATDTPAVPTPVSNDDVIATARAAALEGGGLGLWETDGLRDEVLIALACVVRNRVGTPGFGCGTAKACASDTSQFQAVARNPSYEPTQHEQDIARGVLAASQNQDSTGNAVYFHDFTAAPGPYWQLRLTSPNGYWGFYLYTNEQCPGGPRAGGVGCSFVLTPTPM